MLVLALVGVLAGIITGLSPCILPVLPVVFMAGATPERGGAAPADTADTADTADSTDTADTADTTPTPGADAAAAGSVAVATATRTRRHRSARPYLVVGGLVTSFAFFTLLGQTILGALGLPQDLLRNVGLAILFVVGLGLVFQRLGELLERPFTRIPQRGVKRDGGAFVLGLGLGLVFVPCAGPVLAAVTVVAASGEIGLRSVILTTSFALGVAIPLLGFALAGEQVGTRVRAFRQHAAVVRRVGGVILVVVALALAFNATDALQRAIPGYTSSLQNALGSTDAAKRSLGSVTNSGSDSKALDACPEGSARLESCGPAPAFEDIEAWLNTPGGEPLTLDELRGRVVLLDFWTYSCINCQRTIPHVRAWHDAYEKAGLTVVGVHTPEFPFERVVGNVREGAADLGVTYPVAVDNGYGTWSNYGNRFWPSQYLIDADGTVRHVKYGEGDYGTTENLIRALLIQADPGAKLPPPTAVDDTTPTGTAITPETYLGYNRMSGNSGEPVVEGRDHRYTAPDSLPVDSFAFDGDWNVGPRSAVAGTDARLVLHHRSTKVFAVLGGSGRVTVTDASGGTSSVAVSGNPRLYPLRDGDGPRDETISLAVSPGVGVYTFTFG